MANLGARTIIEGDAVFVEFKGALAEQFVFQQLKPNEGLSVHYFSFENSKYEVDFIVQNENDEIIPVEAKSGENLKARSFRFFCDRFRPQTAIRASLSNYRKEDWMTNVPLYLIGSFFNGPKTTLFR